MNDKVWVILGKLLLAVLLGVVGQLARVVVGLKKENDQADAANQSFKQRFNPGELLVSLAIAVGVGAVAGVLAALTKIDVEDPQSWLTILAAGYAGTDFIEGFMRKALPESQPASPPDNKAIAAKV